MIDSHCHLTDGQFSGDLDAVISRARAAGISPLITISDSLEESQKSIDIANNYDDIFCTIGIHPHNAKDWNDGDIENLHQLAQQKKVVGIGEIGLDYHYMNSPMDIQKVVFEKQLRLAKELELPAIIHTREAIEDTRKIIDLVHPKSLVLHCCCEEWSNVEYFVERGFFLSFTGIATYPQSEVIRNTIKQCPLENLMIETDAPYLAPVPSRGKRNEPAFLVEVARCVAKEKGISPEEVDRATTENAKKFFGIDVSC